MKRSALRRRSRRRGSDSAANSGREVWKTPRKGFCAVCGRYGWLVRHHVLYQQHVRREGGDVWALSNAMDLGRDCNCHAAHHSGFKRIPVDVIPSAAMDFMVRLLGDDRAQLFVERYYRT